MINTFLDYNKRANIVMVNLVLLVFLSTSLSVFVSSQMNSIIIPYWDSFKLFNTYVFSIILFTIILYFIWLQFFDLKQDSFLTWVYDIVLILNLFFSTISFLVLMDQAAYYSNPDHPTFFKDQYTILYDLITAFILAIYPIVFLLYQFLNKLQQNYIYPIVFLLYQFLNKLQQNYIGIFPSSKVDEHPLTGHTASRVPIDLNGNPKYGPLSGMKNTMSSNNIVTDTNDPIVSLIVIILILLAVFYHWISILKIGLLLLVAYVLQRKFPRIFSFRNQLLALLILGISIIIYRFIPTPYLYVIICIVAGLLFLFISKKRKKSKAR